MVSERIDALMTLDEFNKDLLDRNAERLRKMKEQMGKKYVLHPDNAMTKEKFKLIKMALASKV